MAEKRKLQAEIERVLKKVGEGVEEFESMWDKVHSASTSSQKEKYEADLKKEIKKLQRLRDQIKTWLTSNDIKDKSELMKNRRLIEKQMERFKVVERETKTKAFSKEGLMNAARLDPAEKKKNEAREWINNCTGELIQQVDGFEAEVEALSGKKKRKGPDSDRKARLEELIASHKEHERKLEIVLRLLDNGTIEPDALEDIKDDVEYYISDNQDPDYEENDYIYDSLPVDLDDFEEELGLVEPEIPDPTLAEKKKKDKEKEKKIEAESNDQTQATKSAVPSAPTGPTTNLSESVNRSASMGSPAKSLPASTGQPTLSAKTSSGTDKLENVNLSMNVNTGPSEMRKVLISEQPKGPPAAFPGAIPNPAVFMGESPARNLQPQTQSPWQGTNTVDQIQNASPNLATQSDTKQQQSTSTQQQQQIQQQMMQQRDVQQRDLQHAHQAQQAHAKQQQIQLHQHQHQLQQQNHMQPQSNQAQQQQQPSVPSGPPYPGHSLSGNLAGIGLDPGVNANANPNGIANESSNMDAMSAALQESMDTCPTPTDSQRRNNYVAINPVVASPDYPSQLAPIFGNSAIYEKLEPDTLFFIFYFQPGTYQQYLAARELKKQSWRFHKRYSTWFQRHEEPKSITEEYEQGTYVYFDYETGWCQRKKTDFTFEYRYLEDQDLP
eukprot:CFRG0444T1